MVSLGTSQNKIETTNVELKRSVYGTVAVSQRLARIETTEYKF